MEAVGRYIKVNGAGLAALVLVLAFGCTTSSRVTIHPQPSQTATARTFIGGCAGTVLTDAEPPAWAQGGWTVDKGASWPVPWALGTQDNTVAYVFANQLVAGTSPRRDGSQNKILWEARDSPSGANITVVGHPMGKSQPTFTIVGGPSITDVPTPGCWVFQLSWDLNGRQTSTINLDVLPAGSLPPAVS